ncbi:hypothetical protein H1C71_028814, partial [Ictidomys tridecemlineatus]
PCLRGYPFPFYFRSLGRPFAVTNIANSDQAVSNASLAISETCWGKGEDIGGDCYDGFRKTKKDIQVGPRSNGCSWHRLLLKTPHLVLFNSAPRWGPQGLAAGPRCWKLAWRLGRHIPRCHLFPRQFNGLGALTVNTEKPISKSLSSGSQILAKESSLPKPCDFFPLFIFMFYIFLLHTKPTHFKN